MVNDQIAWTAKFEQFINHEGPLNPNNRFDWWINPINLHSMRLTNEGFKFASVRAKISYYSHSLDAKIMPKTLLQLEKYMQYPYYIKTLSEINIFEESTSMMLSLYDNKLQTYLDNIQKSI